MCVSQNKSNNISEIGGATVNKNNLSVRRSDIYMAELTGNYEMLQGLHPVLIISCKKSMENTTLINIVPITSTLKSNIANIPISKESGLLHDSFLLCSQVRTISKHDLQNKVGYVKPQLMDTVIRTIVKNFDGRNNELSLMQNERLNSMVKAIKNSILFKVKYNITDIEIDQQIDNSLSEIKDYCKSLNVEYKKYANLEIFRFYQEKRKQIREVRLSKDYKLTTQLLEEYLSDLYEMDYNTAENDICSEFEFVYYNLALSSGLLGDIDKSYDYSKQALTFSMSEDNNRVLSYWCIGECCSYKGKDYSKEGIEMFGECLKFYKNINEKKFVILSQFNIYKMQSDKCNMQKCIKEYEETHFNNVLHSFGDFEKDEVLLQLRKELNDIL